MMALALIITLLITALFQILGVLLAWFFLRNFRRHQNFILLAEIIIMVIISAEIIFFSLRESFASLYGVVAGLVIVALINYFVPHKHSDKMGRISLMVFIAMCIHELPEGIAFGSAYLLSQNIGLLTAALIALHNIPEGTIVAMPYLLRNKVKRAFSLSIITQILYITGGIGAYYFLLSLSSAAQATSACIAAGAMLFIAFEELKFLE
jgi:ZIP family zinc transporter